jgi:nicotinamidase-related amidase
MVTANAEYLEPLTKDNVAVLFVDNQTGLMSGVQSIDHTLLIRNTEALAELARLYRLPVVLTTTGGGASGPGGGLLPAITDAFPDVPVIDRMQYFNAMSDPSFAQAVQKTDRKKILISGITTDYCVVYPAMSLIRAGAHVYVVTDTCGSWNQPIEESALARLIQMGATPINVQAVAGELQNSYAVSDRPGSLTVQPGLMAWFKTYGPATGLMLKGMEAAAKAAAR